MRGVRRVVICIATLAVVAAAGFVSWDRWWRRAGPANPGLACPVIVKAGDRVPFAATGVHRVTLIGDSIMVQASCAIARGLAGIGIQTSRHAVSGSGLLTGTVNWLAETRHILRTERPDVVVAIFVGNYAPPPLHDASGAVIGADSPAFYRLWQRRAQQLSAVVRASGARMYWVSPPPIKVPRIDRSQRLYDGYRTLGDHVLSSGQVLAGPHGSEVPAKLTCGRRRAIRAVDAVHLTDDGGRIYGQQIAHDLSADVGILTAPKPC